MSEADSDAESLSPAVKGNEHLSTSGGMCYLSPFTMGSRGDRTVSESNLSSSGYSSMASPGPSRCGSSNPLCPSEMEDPGPSGSSLSRRPSPHHHFTTSECSDRSGSSEKQQKQRGRSDSETLSDEPLMESNDEGIGTDHLDEKIEEGELKSAKELEVFITNECETTKIEPSSIITSLSVPRVSKCLGTSVTLPSMTTLQLPSIVIQNDASPNEKHLSPMSSRSESPLSDKTNGPERFSPQFYGRNKDSLPFTDSDGLYDFPSSDKVNVYSSTQTHRKSTGRRREKGKCAKVSSPTKVQIGDAHVHLYIPNSKEASYKTQGPRRPSPKRRSRNQHLFSSSSSSDSIASAREIRCSSSTPSPDTIRWSSPTSWIKEGGSKCHGYSDDNRVSLYG